MFSAKFWTFTFTGWGRGGGREEGGHQNWANANKGGGGQNFGHFVIT